MNDNERRAYALIALAAVPAVLIGVECIRNVVKERRTSWDRKVRGGIRAAQQRLVRIAEDPNSTTDDVLDAWKQEAEFLNIIKNQPR